MQQWASKPRASNQWSSDVQALRAVPDVNASWMGDFIRVYHNVDVSVAVQTPSGLMVPIVGAADALGVAEIAAAVKDLAAKVRALDKPLHTLLSLHAGRAQSMHVWWG